MPDKVPFQRGTYAAFVAESIVIGTYRHVPGAVEYVGVMLEFVQDNLDKPVGRMVYKATPEMARQLAQDLLHEADVVEAAT